MNTSIVKYVRIYEDENARVKTTINPARGTPLIRERKEVVIMDTAEAINSATLFDFESMQQFNSFRIYSLHLLRF